MPPTRPSTMAVGLPRCGWIGNWGDWERDVVYVNRAANSDWLQTRYDQPIDHLHRGADDAIRPDILSARLDFPHHGDSAVPSALARWHIDCSGVKATQCQASTSTICRSQSQARLRLVSSPAVQA